MVANRGRVLAVAARCGRLGCVVIDNGDLIIWDSSRKGASSVQHAMASLQAWLDEFRPDVLVTENPDSAGRKQGRQLRILRAFVDIGRDANIVNLVIRRQRPFASIYDEAEHFGEQFPDFAPLIPTRPALWEKEPYQMIYFEALALVRDAGLFPADEAV